MFFDDRIVFGILKAYQTDLLCEVFTVGKLSDLQLTFTGRRITKQSDRLINTQKRIMDDIEPINVDTDSTEPSSSSQDSDSSRTTNVVCKSERPLVPFVANTPLLSHIREAIPVRLKLANKSLRRLKYDLDVSLIYSSFPVTSSLCLILYTDASF